MLGEFVFWLSLFAVWAVFAIPVLVVARLISWGIRSIFPKKVSEASILRRDLRVARKQIVRLRAKLMVVLLLLVFFAPIVGSPAIVGDAQVASEMIESPQIIQENQFLESADGDISSDSIGESYSNKFRETTADDVLYFPDTFYNDTVTVVDAGNTTGDGSVGDYTDTWTADGDYYQAYGNTILYATIVLEIPRPTNADGMFITIRYGVGSGGSGDWSSWWGVYNADTTSYDAISNLTHTSLYYRYKTTYDPDHFTDKTYLKFFISDTVGGAVSVSLDYVGIQYYIMTLADSDSYAESFADISDISLHSGDNVPATDGDLMYWDIPGDNGWDYLKSDGPSVSAGSAEYAEVRISANISGAQCEIQFFQTDGQGGGTAGSISYGEMGTISTTAKTVKEELNFDDPVGSWYLLARSASPARIYFDYLRVGPSTEFGWQHDGSTVEGVTALTGGSISSDGDELSLVADSDGSTFEIVVDTTATAAMLSTTYYPFLGLSFNSGDSADYIMVESYDGSAWATVIANTTIGTSTLRANIKAVDSYIEKFRLSVNPSATVRMDWMKGHSIANFTVTQHVSCSTGDILYVDSGALVSDRSSGTVNYIKLDHDPALSISDTYSVWNLTMSNIGSDQAGSYDWYHQAYVAGWNVLDQDETRGATPFGTITDYRIYITESFTLSAIEFIEDGTAPSVVRSSATPPDPDDNEVITLSAVATDTVEVYTVKFNAISAPAAFSDVDYSATEITNNLWTYTFSSGDFPSGYYCFSVIANDGANENTLTTEQEFVDFTVREATIIIQEITLIGAGTDFTMMTFSARINRDCTYTIYEESTNNAETDTFAGSVSAPSFNLAWTKLSTTDPNVNFTIKFVSGSLTYNYTSQYQVAQTTFYVEDRAKTETPAKVTITGRITKFANYLVYDNTGNIKETGSITSLDFKVSFDKWVLNTGQEIFFAIKFTNGSQTCWVNWTYYAIDIDEYGYVPAPGAAAPSWALTQTYWNILFMGVIIVAIIATRVQVGNLPNWRK